MPVVGAGIGADSMKFIMEDGNRLKKTFGGVPSPCEAVVREFGVSIRCPLSLSFVSFMVFAFTRDLDIPPLHREDVSSRQWTEHSTWPRKLETTLSRLILDS